MTDLGATTATARSGRDNPTGDGIVSPGDTVGGRYVVEEVLGSGGMGVVVAARHASLGHRVAMKLMSASANADAETYARFTREARIIANLESDHVVRVTDFGIHAGSPYMVMDLLAGRDLRSELNERGPLPVAEAVDYVIQACDGLWSTHVKGIVHRDVKLANLFLAARADGERVIKVLDFGVSKSQDDYEDVSLTRTATLIGSPLYMAPEQIRDPRLVDERADVWSLGIVLYKLLTDQAPFSGQSTNAVCAAIAADAPTPLRAHAAHLPRELETVVARCLEKGPEHRYPSVAALARDLAPFASEAGAALARQFTAALPANENRATAPRARRTALGAGLVVLVVAASGGIWLGQMRPSPTAASPTPAASALAAPALPETAAVGAVELASSRSMATDMAAPSALDRELRRPHYKHATPSGTSRAAPASSRFGGSALDDHQ